MFFPKPPKPPAMDLIGGLSRIFNDPATQNTGFTPELQQGWLDQWNIQPAQDARYLPIYPAAEDNTLGADIRRNWHDLYKNFSYGKINEHAPFFGETMPRPRPAQSYGDFMGEVQGAADQAMSGMSGLDAAAELFGNTAYGGFSPGKGAPKQPPAPQPEPEADTEQFFKPYDEMLREIEERQARGEVFDENNNWVPAAKPAFDPSFDIKQGEFFPSPEQIWQKMQEAEQAGLDPYEALGVERMAEGRDVVEGAGLEVKQFGDSASFAPDRTTVQKELDAAKTLNTINNSISTLQEMKDMTKGAEVIKDTAKAADTLKDLKTLTRGFPISDAIINGAEFIADMHTEQSYQKNMHDILSNIKNSRKDNNPNEESVWLERYNFEHDMRRNPQKSPNPSLDMHLRGEEYWNAKLKDARNKDAERRKK